MNTSSTLSNFFLILTTVTFAAFSAKQPAAPKTEFEKFAERFAPPEDVKRTIENAPRNETHWWNSSRWPYQGLIEGQKKFFIFRTSPDIVAKNQEINRIGPGYFARRCIELLQLNKLSVPEKCIHHHDNQWGVAARAIKQDTRKIAKHFSYEDVEQLIQFQEQMCYRDLHTGNVYKDTYNQINIIDTERRSFSGDMHWGDSIYSKKDCVRILYHFLSHHEHHIDIKTEQLLLTRILQLSQSKDGSKPRNFLKEAQRFNDTGIDFEKAEEEFYQKYKK